ncbi:Dihydroxyacetone synthase [Steccherinum ochraceum]|uniref:Dihydroxyacetone synthase n=1 Tax=Steccherinum ochraceum TaxID=92696 RepID=A0A4R0RZS6_9APHY|nr:Dihydroxyacetone synthase [Steccherinum ochraceum]
MRFVPAFVAVAAAVTAVSGRVINELLGRTTLDVCAQIDANLAVDVLGIAVVVGALDICLCIDAIVDILKVNAVVIAAVDLVGEAAVVAELTALINGAAGHESCTYPDHFQAVCSKGNPCGFQCKDGFTPSPPSKPIDCVCVPPKIVCNGVCGDFKACPSSIAKRELEVEKRNAVCDRGYTPCGVFGWSGMRASQAWECVDTQSDLESCGGCAVPLVHGSPHGVDCTAIPGVADVACGGGSCIVHRCLPGYVPSLDRSFCIRKSNLKFEFDDEVPAAAYGLEHLPFNKKSN